MDDPTTVDDNATGSPISIDEAPTEQLDRNAMATTSIPVSKEESMDVEVDGVVTSLKNTGSSAEKDEAPTKEGDLKDSNESKEAEASDGEGDVDKTFTAPKRTGSSSKESSFKDTTPNTSLSPMYISYKLRHSYLTVWKNEVPNHKETVDEKLDTLKGTTTSSILIDEVPVPEIPLDSSTSTSTPLLPSKREDVTDKGALGDENISSRKRTCSSVSSDEAPTKKVGRRTSIPLKQEGGQPKPKQGLVDDSHDKYCWVCHKEGVYYHCRICPRSYHTKCITVPESSDSSKTEEDSPGISKVCVCPECVIVMKAENVESRSDAMKMLTVDQLSNMLKYICGRLRAAPGAEPFLNPVQSGEAEDYFDFIVYPMDVQTLEKNIKQRQYGSTEAFLSDFQWIVHNSIVFNSATSAYTNAAKRLLKVCKQELVEIETCPECYMNAHKKPDTWFVEACVRPHILVWAKLKGFPFWPAKAMKIKDEQVDARFFGQHDRAWVNIKDCVLYSEEMPCPPPKKTGLLNAAIEELNEHVKNLKERFGEVTFATVKTPVEPNLSVEQIQLFLPKFVPQKPPMEEAGNTSLAKKYPLRSKFATPKTEVKTNAKEKSLDETIEPTEKQENEERKVDLKSGDAQEEDTDHDPRVPSGEILANALGLRRIKRKSSQQTPQDPKINSEQSDTAEQKAMALRKSTRSSNNNSNGSTVMKRDQNDIPEPMDTTKEPSDGNKQTTKAQNLMEQISNQTQTKPGYRFNISKDISISAIEDSDEESVGDRNAGEKTIVNRFPPGDGRNANQGGLLRPSGSQRFLSGKDAQSVPALKQERGPMSSAVRPVHKLQQPPRGTQQAAASLMPSIRKGKDGSYQAMGDGNLAQGGASIPPHSNQSTQGAITLPGGNITVTPLSTSVVAGVSTAAKGTNGLPMNIENNPRFTKVVRGQVHQQPQRNLSSTSSTSITGHHVQQCMKSLEESVRKTVEQVFAEAQLSAGKTAPSDRELLLQQRFQRAQKELVDAKHNSEVTIKELRANFEIDKKRALADQKRQFDQEKQRMAAELKKKQWCASCGREALFYCCWNTSYCDYQCQEEHWPNHMGTCTQGQNRNAAASNQLINGGR